MTIHHHKINPYHESHKITTIISMKTTTTAINIITTVITTISFQKTTKKQ